MAPYDQSILSLSQEIVRGRLGAPHVHRRDSSAQITTIDSCCASDTTATSVEDVDRYNLAAAVSAAAASVNKRRRSSLAQVRMKYIGGAIELSPGTLDGVMELPDTQTSKQPDVNETD